MGIRIALEKESGVEIDSIDDDKNVLHRYLLQDSVGILGDIDWYGNTIFNNIQMQKFLPAWRSLLSNAHDESEKDLLSAVLKLAERCANGIHLYLKFTGD